MNNFSWSKAFGFGILLWAILFVVGLLLVTFGVTLSIGWVVGMAVLAAILSYSFALATSSRTSGQALGYGFLWAAIGIVLDLIITRQFSAGEGVFNQWSYWVGYALILFAPWAEYEIQGAGAELKAV